MSKLHWLLLICRLVTFAAMVVALVAALLAGRWQRQAARARRETARIVAGGPIRPVRRSEHDPREFLIPLTTTAR